MGAANGQGGGGAGASLGTFATECGTTGVSLCVCVSRTEE